MEEVFGGVISSYSRAQAIEDGVLVDVTEMARKAGIVYPVALTSAVYQGCVQVPKGLEHLQDEPGRLHDVLWMYRWAVKVGIIRGDHGLFEVSFLMWEGKNVLDARLGDLNRKVTLKAVCGPGDDPSPCITIMLPDED